MIRLKSPSAADLTKVAADAAAASPSAPLESELRPFEYEQTVGHGRASFDAGRQALVDWRMHRDAGVHAVPAPLVVGSDVVMWTRALVITLVFACRITDVVDSETEFGFTYATLPGHPEEGHETFRIELINDVVQLHIEGASRPDLWLNRLAGPIGTRMEQRVTDRYIAAMRSAILQAID